MPEPTDAERIATLEKRLDLLKAALRSELSAMGRSFGNAEFDRQWDEAAEPEEEED